MWNGFYSFDNIKSDGELRSFFITAMDLSYSYRIDIKDDSYKRTLCRTLTLNDIKDMVSLKHHNVCIDRTIQRGGLTDIDEGEVGFCTLGRDYDVFLYIFMTKENLNKLVSMYNLNKL